MEPDNEGGDYVYWMWRGTGDGELNSFLLPIGHQFIEGFGVKYIAGDDVRSCLYIGIECIRWVLEQSDGMYCDCEGRRYINRLQLPFRGHTLPVLSRVAVPIVSDGWLRPDQLDLHLQ